MTDSKKNIWEIATELSRVELKSDKPNGNSTLVFVGSKQGGKTSTIYRFIDKNDSPKPTVALEYLFVRKPKATEAGKDVCNIWELGGGVLFNNLLEFAITHQTLSSTSIVLVVDLSAPEELIITTETLLNSIRELISSLLSNKSEKTLETYLKDRAIQRIGKDHEDIGLIKPFPIPLLIIGSKYDIFQDLDPEKKKLIVRYLRLMSHSIGAQLIFVSTKSEALINKSRIALNNLAFETPIDSFSFYSDYTKPILIPFGSDTFQRIGHESIEAVKRTYTSIFPQLVTKLVIPDDPAKDINFKERDIDLIRNQKDRDLEEYKRQLEVQLKSRNVKV